MELRSRECTSYLSRAAAARLAGVTIPTIKNWIDKGHIQQVLIGGDEKALKSHVVRAEVEEKMRGRAERAEVHAKKLAQHVKEVQS